MLRKGENIYKRKDGRWEGRYIKSRTPAGKASYGYVYVKTYREVKSKLVNQILFTSNSTTANQRVPTVCFECIAMEQLQTIYPQIKESSSDRYRSLLNSYVLPAFGLKPLYDITHDFIEGQCNLFLTEGGLRGNGLSAKTVPDILSLTRNIMQFAAKKGNIISCNAQSIQIKRQIPEMRVLGCVEQEKLRQYLCSDLDACSIGILVCLFIGLRVGEIRILCWEDISFSGHTIHVHQTLQRIQNRVNSKQKTKIAITAPKSAYSICTIPVPNGLIIILASYKTSSKGHILTNCE